MYDEILSDYSHLRFAARTLNIYGCLVTLCFGSLSYQDKGLFPMANKAILLPPKDDMLRRLIEVQDADDLKEALYPLILEFADTEKDALGIVLMLNQAFDDYVEHKGQWTDCKLQRLLPLFIDALVDDKDIAAAAKEFHDTVTTVIP